MFQVAFPVHASCGNWSGDNDVVIELSEEEYAILRSAISDAEEEDWPYLDDDGDCAALFPRILDAVTESLEDAGFDYDPDDIEIMVGLPEETE